MTEAHALAKLHFLYAERDQALAAAKAAATARYAPAIALASAQYDAAVNARQTRQEGSIPC